MKKLIALCTIVLAGIVGGLVGGVTPAKASVTCNGGYSWDQWVSKSLTTSPLFADINDIASSGSTGQHSIGRIGVQDNSNTNGATPQTQVGIIQGQLGPNYYSTPHFYFEEQGAAIPPVGWVNGGGSPTFYDYVLSSPVPTKGVAYPFYIYNEGGNNFILYADGVESPEINIGPGANADTYANEIYSLPGTCLTSEYQFTNPSPWNFGAGSGVWINGGSNKQGANPGLFSDTLYSNTNWLSNFPVSCQPHCNAPVRGQ